MGHTCRGTINLINAIVHTEDSCCFVINNGGNHTFHLKASSEVDRQKWVTALELAKATAIRDMEGKVCVASIVTYIFALGDLSMWCQYVFEISIE